MTTQKIMLTTIAALLPGVAALVWVYGAGVLWNLAILCVACTGFEALCLRLRGQDSRFALADGSALLTALLIGICLPPFVDPVVLTVAALAAIGLAKHAYGGLGQNTFNPAMVGYAVILVSYPEALAQWPGLHAETDALSGATLLSQFRYRDALTVAEFYRQYAPDTRQTDVVALAFLVGGAILVYRRVIGWRIPVTVLATVATCALLGYDQGSSASNGSVWFHLTTGGLVAAAFFVATDPVTHPSRAGHQIVFAVVIGVIVYWIRAAGSFPDGIAFAVLLGNCTTPFLNRLHFRERVHA